MRKFLAKIWFPVAVTAVIATESFGIDAGRMARLGAVADSLELTSVPDTLSIDSISRNDSISLNDSIVADTLVINPADTIKVPDSLRLSDPLRYKYYIAIKDSATRVSVRGSLMAAGDTLELHLLDSLYIKDSTDVAIAKFNAWYSSLSRKERKKYDYEQALPAKIEAMRRKMEVKDSIKAVKDSIIEATPRVLSTYVLPDSMQYKRLISWTHERYFQNLDVSIPDTSYNAHFHEYPFFKNDVNATYLGVIGSPVLTYNYFKREETDNAIFYTPYQCYNYSPESLPNYNTKTPYTELAYWGTLFANKEKEEQNIKILSTQNITPALNLNLEYHRFGGNGILQKEKVNNRTAVVALNYLGKKYLMHTGYIYHMVEKSENGGIQDNSWIRDTTVDAREIDIRLNSASNKLKKHTAYLDQTFRIQFNFIEKAKQKKALKLVQAHRDSILASGDSLAIERMYEKIAEDSLESIAVKVDTINKDLTSAFIGHSSELSSFRKVYKDEIGLSDAVGRAFYNDRFYINPTKSADSLRVLKFENRVFLRLQPFKSDAIVSKIDVGIGDKMAKYFLFNPNSYIGAKNNVTLNSAYVYAGANGRFKKYLTWDASGKYNFAGYEVNDFGINANLSFSAYPFRRDRNSPLTLKASFETSLKEPDYYQQHLYTNHFKWDNNFSKTSVTKVNARLEIPRWKLEAGFSYGLLDGNIYYDTEGIVRQNNSPMSVIAASLKKDFTIWKFHLDHRLLLQFSSNEDVLPLPLFSCNLRYYFQFNVVKNVMQMQVGANGMFTTKWYAPAYNPVLGVFHNQDREKYGNVPYVDVFLNIQWKRACIFLKVVNLNMGWGKGKADYFSADGYIAPQRAFKVGISWPFYILPGRRNTSASGSQPLGGGGRQSSMSGSGSPDGIGGRLNGIR